MRFCFRVTILFIIALWGASLAGAPRDFSCHYRCRYLNPQGLIYYVYSDGKSSQISDATDFVQISAGSEHIILRKADGSFWAMGSNSNNQATNYYTTVTYAHPVQYRSDWKFVASDISAGGYFNNLLNAAGARIAFGANGSGQIGNGLKSTSVVSPSTPVALDKITWKNVASGAAHSLGIGTDGSLYGWGANDKGQIGNGSTTDVLIPTQIGSGKWLKVAAGDKASLAIASDSSLYQWGDGILAPTVISNEKWQSIATSYDHFLAIRNDGALFGWSKTSPTPARLGTGTWQRVSVGYEESMGMMADGSLWIWLNENFDKANPITIHEFNPGSKPIVLPLTEDVADTFEIASNYLNDGYSLVGLDNRTTQQSYAACTLSVASGKLIVKPTKDINGIHEVSVVVGNGTAKGRITIQLDIAPVRDPLKLSYAGFNTIPEQTPKYYSVKNFVSQSDPEKTLKFVSVRSVFDLWKINAKGDSIYLSKYYNYEANVYDTVYVTITDGIDTLTTSAMTVRIEDVSEVMQLGGITFTDGFTPPADNPKNHFGAGRTVRSGVCIYNSSYESYSAVKIKLRAYAPWIKVTDSVITINNIGSHQTICGSDLSETNNFFEIKIADSIPMYTNAVSFDLAVSDELTGENWLSGYIVPFPQLAKVNIDDDDHADSKGNDDGYVQDGETIEVYHSFNPSFQDWCIPHTVSLQSPAGSSMQVLSSGGIQNDIVDSMPITKNQDFVVVRKGSAAPKLFVTLDADWSHKFGNIPIRFAYPYELNGKNGWNYDGYGAGSLREDPTFKGVEFYSKVVPSSENPSNLVGAGRKIRFRVELYARTLNAFYGVLQSRTPKLTITDSIAVWNHIDTAVLSQDWFEAILPDPLPADGQLKFMLKAHDGIWDFTKKRRDSIEIIIPLLDIAKVLVDDDEVPDSQGDDDDILEPGERVELLVALKNPSPIDIDDVSGKLLAISPLVAVHDYVKFSTVYVYNSVMYNMSGSKIYPIRAKTEMASPDEDFVITISGDATYQHRMQLNACGTWTGNRKICYALPFVLNPDSPRSPINTAPIIGYPANFPDAQVGVPYSLQISLTDADADPLTLTAGNLPAWMSYNAVSRTLEGIPLKDTIYNELYFTVSDGIATTRSSYFTILVKPQATNPTDPTDPTDPTNPTDPTGPTNPTDPTDPTNPTDPTDPVVVQKTPSILPYEITADRNGAWVLNARGVIHVIDSKGRLVRWTISYTSEPQHLAWHGGALLSGRYYLVYQHRSQPLLIP